MSAMAAPCATMNARALGARKTNPVRGAGRRVVAASSRRVAAVTSAQYKVRAANATALLLVAPGFTPRSSAGARTREAERSRARSS